MTQAPRKNILYAAAVLLLLAGPAFAQSPAPSTTGTLTGVKTIQVAGGGTIYMGALAGQPTPQTGMGKVLQRVTALCGDRPVLGKLDKNTTGEILAGFFTVTGKKLDGKPMEGLVIVYAPKTGSAAAAVLLDDADRFPTTVNTMFARLKQQLGAPSSAAPSAAGPSATPAASTAPTKASSAAPVPSGPTQPLQKYTFPDGTGAIGLPMGWKVSSAQKGQVIASGPNNEGLRFGWAVSVIDPTNPQSHTLMPNSRGPAPQQFVAIPYSADPGTAYKAALTQFAQKARHRPPIVDIASVNNLPANKNYMLYGDTDFNDGKGKQSFIAQVIDTAPQMMGTWQMTLFIIYAPQQTMASEIGTFTAIFNGYTSNQNRIASISQAQTGQALASEKQFMNTMSSEIDASDRSVAGFDNVLRNQTVIVDTQTGGHATTSDDLANALINANPNLFQSVSTSGYIPGIDY
jgi:hypothetical protein